MGLRKDVLKEEVVDRIVESAHGKMSGAKAAFAETFIRHFYENVPAGEIAAEETEDLYGAALSLWSFAATRKAGAAKIRVYNPCFDQHGWHSAHTVIEVVNDDMPFLVDSLTADLNRHGIAVHQLIHPVFAAKRDSEGKTTALTPVRDGDAGRESCIPTNSLRTRSARRLKQR